MGTNTANEIIEISMALVRKEPGRLDKFIFFRDMGGLPSVDRFSVFSLYRFRVASFGLRVSSLEIKYKM